VKISKNNTKANFKILKKENKLAFSFLSGYDWGGLNKAGGLRIEHDER